MKKWERPQVRNLLYSMTNFDYDMLGGDNGGGNGGDTSPGNLNHKCPDCGGCFQSKEALANHRGTRPNNPYGGKCPGYGGGICKS